mmetsp:Transcript_38687/g.71908  ORF Transcript_38687/g.71908 Transcript_38687/m.71908 type:complete len:202 (-) Transcript_38687:860-1465(-)
MHHLSFCLLLLFQLLLLLLFLHVLPDLLVCEIQRLHPRVQGLALLPPIHESLFCAGCVLHKELVLAFRRPMHRRHCRQGKEAVGMVPLLGVQGLILAAIPGKVPLSLRVLQAFLAGLLTLLRPLLLHVIAFQLREVAVVAADVDFALLRAIQSNLPQVPLDRLRQDSNLALAVQLLPFGQGLHLLLLDHLLNCIVDVNEQG